MRAPGMLSIILATVLMGTPAAAQQGPLAPLTTPGLVAQAPAPTGHRQPRLKDLPPDVQQKETGETPKANENADEQDRGNQRAPIKKNLRICRTC